MTHGGGVDLWAYRQYMAARYAPSTIPSRWRVAAAWLELFPDPSTATYRDVEAYLRQRGLAASSTRAELVRLRAFYRWLMREGLALGDPTQLVDRPRVPARLPRPAPDREIARMMATGDVQLRALFALMACAGLRCIEASRLDWRDVDLAAGTVIVYGKGDRERRLAVSPDVVRALSALRLATAGRGGAVFVGPTGRRMLPHRISQHVNTSIRAAGGTSTAHMLRHRCATVAYEMSGGDLLAVRDLLGHASVSTTQIYTKVVDGRAAEISRAMTVPAA